MTPREPERTATAEQLAAERAKLDRAASGAWRDVAADRDVVEVVEVAAAETILNDVFGPGIARDTTGPSGLRTYASPCCGVVASVPSHQSFCDARHAARIWRSAPAVAARKASAELHAFLDATPPGDPEDPDADWLAAYVALAGPLDRAATALLAELDREAGAEA